jgi:hypothetical protein
VTEFLGSLPPSLVGTVAGSLAATDIAVFTHPEPPVSEERQVNPIARGCAGVAGGRWRWPWMTWCCIQGLTPYDVSYASFGSDLVLHTRSDSVMWVLQDVVWLRAVPAGGVEVGRVVLVNRYSYFGVRDYDSPHWQALRPTRDDVEVSGVGATRTRPHMGQSDVGVDGSDRSHIPKQRPAPRFPESWE